MAKTAPVFILLIFVLIAGSRDALAEHLLKSSNPPPPALLIATFALSAILLGLALGVFGAKKGNRIREVSEVLKGRWKGNSSTIIALNVVTAGAYGLTILAIWSDLGAAYNSFIDYGLTPIFTLFLAVKAGGERLRSRGVIAIILACLGILFISLTQFEGGQVSLIGKKGGIVSAIFASVCGAFVHLFNKKLIKRELEPWAVLILRMPFTLVLCGLIAFATSGTAVIGEHYLLLPYALFFFALPLYLVLVVFKRMELGRFAVVLYLIPIVTTTIATALGRVDFQIANLIGVGLVVSGMLVANLEGERRQSE